MALTFGAARAGTARWAWLGLAGPAFAVSIGYIDPGNWASDLAAGVYGFSLLWVVLAANVFALVLQLAVTRITIATGNDLGTLIARRWPRSAPYYWAVFQGAAIATDVAEFSGIVLGATLLFRISLLQSVVLGLTIVWSLLLFSRRHRVVDAALAAALAAVGLVYIKLVAVTGPDPGAVLRGALVPTLPGPGAVLIMVAIVGATVMPHNLFLHSSLVKQRLDEGRAPRAVMARFFSNETIVALTAAALINAAILIVGASFHGGADSIAAAFRQLRPAGGIDTAALFGSALFISGVAASTTATSSGDFIFAAFAPVRCSAALRRAITVLPAAGFLLAGADITNLLLWSQTALCLTLPVALVPMLSFLARTGNGSGRSRAFFAGCFATTAVCVALDAALLITMF